MFRWTPEKDKILLALARDPSVPWAVIAAQLGCRTRESVQQRFRDITGLKNLPEKGVAYRWTSGMDAQILRYRDAGLSFAQIGERLCRPRHSVYRRYQALTGAESDRAERVWTPDIDGKLIDYHRRGMSYPAIGRKLGRTKTQCKNRLAALMTERRRRTVTLGALPWTKDLDNRLLALRAVNFGFSSIGRRLGRKPEECEERYLLLKKYRVHHYSALPPRRKTAEAKSEPVLEEVQPEPAEAVQEPESLPEPPAEDPIPEKFPPWAPVEDLMLQALVLQHEPWDKIAKLFKRTEADARQRFESLKGAQNVDA